MTTTDPRPPGQAPARQTRAPGPAAHAGPGAPNAELDSGVGSSSATGTSSADTLFEVPTRTPGAAGWEAATPGVRALVVVVLGVPAPQGSKRHVGRGVMIESSKKVKPWREAVKQAAGDIIAVAGETGRLTADFPLDGPLLVEMCFTLARPKSAPKKRIYPDRTPDLSKLLRSTEDALTDAGAWADDARVVAYHQPRKVYTGSGDPDALDVPGAVIRVWALT